MTDDGFRKALSEFPSQVLQYQELLLSNSTPVTANVKEASLPSLPVPPIGVGTERTITHLQHSVVPNLAQGHAGPRYYGISLKG